MSLIRPRAKLAGLVHPAEEIGPALPRPALEGGLVDDVNTLLHRGECTVE